MAGEDDVVKDAIAPTDPILSDLWPLDVQLGVNARCSRRVTDRRAVS